MTSAQGFRHTAASLPYGKIVVAAVGAFYLYVAAVTVAQAQGDLGNIGWPKVIALSLAPIGIFCALRYPVIFPFGLYIALAPFDSLLSVAGSSSLVRIVGFAVFGALGLRMLRLRKLYVPQQAWYAWLALVLYASITLFWTPDFANGWNTFFSIFMLFVMMTVLAIYPINRREFDVMLAVVVISGVGAAILCVHQFYSGAATHDVGARLDLSQNGASIDENYLAGSFLMPLAFAMAALFYVKNVFIKLACAGAICMFLGAIFVNGSREALLSLVAIFAYFVVRSRHRLIALAIGALGLSSIMFFPNIVSRLFSKDVADGSGRTEIWKIGMHSFGDHWFLGAGIGSYQDIYDRNLLQVAMAHFAGWHRPGHSLIFTSLNDFGILGSLIVIACWYVGFRQLREITPDSPLFRYRVACEAAILGFAVQALFLDPFYIKYVWIGHSLALVAMNLYRPRVIGLGRRLIARAPAGLFAAHTYRGG